MPRLLFRYPINNDNQLIISSEVGVLHDLDINTVTEKGGLLPGEMLLVDINNEKIVKNAEIKKNIASKNDYQKWNSNIKYFDDLYNEHKSKLNFNEDVYDLNNKVKLFGLSDEIISTLLYVAL